MTTSKSTREIRQKGEYCYMFSPNYDPISEVEPGEVVTIYTTDAFDGLVTSEDVKPSTRITYPYVNPQTGPIFVKTAEPGDTLVVKIHDIQPESEFAWTVLFPEFGGLTGTTVTATLHDPLPELVRIMPIRDGQVIFSDKISLPYEPFMGTIGVAPLMESINCLTSGYYGGNMDCLESCPGHEMHLPVSVPGAHFMTGDAHARQGDGELTGAACEMAARVTVSFDVIKGQKINWPRFVSDEFLMVAGNARPLDDAARIAWKELVMWLVSDYGFDKYEAYHLLGQVGRMRLGNMVDPNYTMVAKMPRKYLT